MAGAAYALRMLLQRCHPEADVAAALRRQGAEHPDLHGLRGTANHVAAQLTAAVQRHHGHRQIVWNYSQGMNVADTGCWALYRLCEAFQGLSAQLRRDPAVLRTVRAAEGNILIKHTWYRDLCGWLEPCLGTAEEGIGTGGIPSEKSSVLLISSSHHLVHTC